MRVKSVFLIFVLVLVAPAAFSFEITNNKPLTPLRWPDNTIPVPYFFVNPGTPDVPGKRELNAVKKAISTWNRKSKGKFRFAGTAGNFGGQNFKNEIVFTRDAQLMPDGVLAVHSTYFFTNDPGTAVEGDLTFNEDVDWITGKTNVNTGKFNVRGIATHELGHGLGLGHSLIADATMYPIYNFPLDKAITPSRDDIAGVRWLYNGVTNNAATPALVTPLNNASYTLPDTDRQITFIWKQSASKDLKNFTVEFSSNPNFTGPGKRYGTRNKIFLIAKGKRLRALINLEANSGQLYWRVLATNGAGARLQSETRSFKITDLL